jgi:hypothetical protein
MRQARIFSSSTFKRHGRAASGGITPCHPIIGSGQDAEVMGIIPGYSSRGQCADPFE